MKIDTDFNPRVRTFGEGMCFFYEGDAAYGDLDIDRSGPRRRLGTRAHGWRYEREAEVVLPAKGD